MNELRLRNRVDAAVPALPAVGRRCARGLLLALLLTLPLGGFGCASAEWVTVRSAPKNPLTERLMLLSSGGPQPTDRTQVLLRRYDLDKLYQKAPEEALGKLQQIILQEPSADRLYAFAELSYLAAVRKQAHGDEGCLDLYIASVAHSYLYLFDERFGQYRNPYDPQFRGACDLYNTSLESALRIVRKHQDLRPGEAHVIKSAKQTLHVNVVSRLRDWRSEDIERFEFVSDFEVHGLKNLYHTYGLGVPLIAVRKKPENPGPADRYYPPGLTFPVTAFLRVIPGGPDGDRQVVLELYDPLEGCDITVENRLAPLETDFSTPLAYFLNSPAFKEIDLATSGLFNPGSNLAMSTRGLYMLEPYQPGKIPVLMVHGLWSSPLTWMEMFNDLRYSRELRNRYQFWFYMYPTGQPFWQTATQLREDLAQARSIVDPEHRDVALDQMVLVGHSMGGLVSRWQTLESEDRFWHLVSQKRLDDLKAKEELKDGLARTFYFHPNSSIKRVITIATPNRGSDFSNSATRWLGQRLITLPKMFDVAEQQLLHDNPDYFLKPNLFDVPTSIDSLAPDSPILETMLAADRASWVTYHNIVGVVPNEGIFGRVAKGTDGVVSDGSAHLDFAASEITVAADHVNVHRHPLSVLEVRRILLEHAGQLEGSGVLPPAYIPAAGRTPFGPPPLPRAAAPATPAR
ncbi:MAG: alpha/beta fold hydrolase [Pirellulales bacterium]